ncbi:MAG: sulfate adenylyltransferase subunit CysD [Gammaproteobacteria bacterium]|nr:sulfate adenylyltransferase subunit CysD [Gammaproteobacteria bacterium]
MDYPVELLENPKTADFWDTQSVHEVLLAAGSVESLRSTERILEKLSWLPHPIKIDDVTDELNRPLVGLVATSLEETIKKKRLQSLILQVSQSDTHTVVFVNDQRLGRRWLFTEGKLDTSMLLQALAKLVGDKSGYIWPVGEVTSLCRDIAAQNRDHEATLTTGTKITFALSAYTAVLTTIHYPDSSAQVNADKLTHLDRLEAESLYIMREVVAQAENPVMLYSIGKDSAVMLHLARKAFYPSPPPFPLMHIDTRWKFRTMYDFRDQVVKEIGMELIVHVNPEGVEKNINPFDHGSSVHTDVMKTQGLKQALDQHEFDVAFGGARRDEEKSRAKERVFSFRTKTHRWDPKNQRPELWNLYNGYKSKGESIRVFPLSNWTELDIWQYIYKEQIPIVPLYFADLRPVVERDGMLMMVDDDRMRLLPGEKIEVKRVRFRTLGCYPLTGAIESSADSLSSIVLELLQSRTSERQGRAIDSDSSGSMEKKKQEGYF